MNTLFVYDIDADALTLANTYNVGINLWGIHANSRDLYAIIDNSNQLAIFTEFFDNPDGLVVASQTIGVENIVRTNGLNYNADRDVIMLTDIGEAGSASDGALVVIKKFNTKIGDGMISAAEQVRVIGAASMLGNPVDAALDAKGNVIYVAERAREGGLLLAFKMPSLSGGIAPVYKKVFAGASAIFVDDAGIGTMGLTEKPIVKRSSFTAEKLYPNPATTTINVDIVSQQTTSSTI